MRASVCASNVFPEPVGLINRMFDFASSTEIVEALTRKQSCQRELQGVTTA